MKKILLLGLVLLFSGCTSWTWNESERTSTGSEPAIESYYGGVAMDDSKGRMDMDMPEEASSSFMELDSEKIIRTGTLSLHMEDVRSSVEAIRSQVEAWGGQVTNSSVTRYENSYVGNVTVRVPSDQFETAFAALKDMALVVDSEYTNSDNITDVYTDLETRLNNLKEEEQQYLKILDQAQTVDEILKVTDYLSNVRYQIESLEGQIQIYDKDINFSTIALTLTEDESIASVSDTWAPKSTVNEALSNWLVFLQNVLDLGIYLIIFGWPVLLLGLIFLPILRRHRGKRRK